MKTFFVRTLNFLIVTFLITNFSFAASELKIKIDNLHSGNGGIALAIFDESNQKEFPTHPEKARVKVYKKCEGKNEVVFTINDLPAGVYAAFAFHDEDSSNSLNTNFIGIPKEGYGASNHALNRFGPPKFQDAKFVFKPNEKMEDIQSISVKY